MCEVRRVFHNVNSDSKTVQPVLSRNKQPFGPEVNEKSKEHPLKQRGTEFPAKENDNTHKDENPKEKKIGKSLENDYSEPKLLTSLKILESIKNIGKEKKLCKPSRSSSQSESSNRKQKASRKLNIPFEEKVYKGLIELQVTDEDLGIQPKLPHKSKDFNKNREPEPVLSDYYKPKFDKEYIVKPGIPKFEIKPVFSTEIPSVYKATKRWEPE